MNTDQAAALREPFPASQIGKLPRAGIQLDYVGHAAVTDRLLQVDPEWSWEPVAFDGEGAPLVKYDGQNAVMWIRLTVCGVTRLGVGIASLKAFELEKQLISDALRNAAMRFGVALDLWSRQDLHDQDGEIAGDGGEPGGSPPRTGDHPPAASPPASGIDAMKPRELAAALAERGLDVVGTVEEMRERLRSAA